MLQKIRLIFAVMVAVLLVAAQSASAKDFVYGSWVSAKHGVNTAGLAPYFKAVERDTGGAVKWRILAGGQMVSARSTLPGVRDRIVDAGLLIPVFNRKEMAHNNVLFDMGMFGSDMVAMGGASIETVMLNCPECLAEYKKQNQVYLGGFQTTDFKLICAKKVTKLSDVKGLKVRAVGANARWVRAMGGSPVAMSPVDGVTAMQRGALACIHGPIAWLTSYGYMDVAKWVIDYPMGNPRALSIMTMNRKSWASLSLAHKKVMIKHMPAASARATLIGYLKADETVKAAALKRGLTFTPGGKEFDDLMAKHRRNEMVAIPKALKKVKVKEKTSKRLMAAYLKNLKKWEKLAPAIGRDVGKLTAAIQREIYDKIDPGKL
jgi:TRAP-type C4-dicarboxylate transport system substrate-binding protein